MSEFYEIVKVERSMDYYFPGLASTLAKRDGQGEVIAKFENYEDAKEALDKMYTTTEGNLITEYNMQRVEQSKERTDRYLNWFSIKNVDLVGTEKQIKYAKNIKMKGYSEMLMTKVLYESEDDVKKAVKAAEAIDSLTDASEIIERSDSISCNINIDNIIDYKIFKDMLNIENLMKYKDAEITILHKNIKTGEIKERKLEHSHIQRFSANNGNAVFTFLHDKRFSTKGIPMKCDGNCIYLKSKSNYIAITFRPEGE